MIDFLIISFTQFNRIYVQLQHLINPNRRSRKVLDSRITNSSITQQPKCLFFIRGPLLQKYKQTNSIFKKVYSLKKTQQSLK